MAAAADKFGKKSKRGFRDASSAAINFRSVLGGVLAAGVISRGMMALRQGIGEVTREFVEFDQALTAAGAKFGGLRRGSPVFAELEAKARELGATTEWTATQAGQALESLAMAGFTADQAMASLAAVTDLATGASVELEEATSMAADALGAFNLRTKDSAQLAKNLTRINDVFAQTVTSSNVVMEDLFETMKFAGPVMTGAGADVETFSALVRELGNAGIKGSLGGTALKNAYLKLAGPVPKAAKLLKKLGVETTDADGNLRDMTYIIDDLKSALGGMGTAQRSAALNTIFGQRAIAGMNVLLSAGGEKLRGFRDEAYGAAGASNALAEDMRKSLMNRLKTLKSALIETGFRVIEAFQKDFPNALDAAIKKVRELDVKPIIKGIKTAIEVVKTLFRWGKKLAPVIGAVAAGFVTFKIAATIAVGIEMLAGAFAVLAPAIMGASSAFGALGAIIAANPIGAIVTAVALLTAGVIWLWQNWDTVVIKLWKAYQAIRSFASEAWKVLSNLLENPFFVAVSMLVAPWLTAAALIIKHWEPVKKFFQEVLAFWEDILGISPGGVVKFWKETLGIGDTKAEGMKGAFSGARGADKKFFDEAKIAERALLDEQKKLTDQIAATSKKMEGANKKEKALLEKKVITLTENLENLNTAIKNASARVGQAPPASAPPPRSPFGGGIKGMDFGFRKPPNEAKEENRKKMGFTGKITLSGAPPGTKLETTETNMPPIKKEVLGANP